LSGDSPEWRLPAPDTSAGRALMIALAERRTTREFRETALEPATLSNLLWAAFGINRPATGGRTAPSAMNAQEIDLYVATAGGLFLYLPGPHALRRCSGEDLRALTGGGAFARVAPVTLVFVANAERQAKAPDERREFYAAIASGCISQNISLFCASEGLATVVHDLSREPLAKAMALGEQQSIVLAQAVGHPAEPPSTGQ
ncbi:MAG: SagB/ThcOx family dehydrogenase, partial [Verrucomicrobiae bacterium]|nr:SagB/ThcOx family dehydrogenase [Verrucomicrobiae bacterium]